MIRRVTGMCTKFRKTPTSLDLTKKNLCRQKMKELGSTTLTSTHQEKDRVPAEVPTFGENLTSTFFLGTKELRMEVTVSSLPLIPNK